MGGRAYIAAASVMASLLGCGAEFGSSDQETQGTPDAAFAPIDAAVVYDASPPDARPPCVEGDDQTEGADGSCYLYFQGPMTWPDANLACMSLGGHLVTAASLAENELLSTIAPATEGLQDIWMGGTDEGNEAVWSWANGDPYQFTHWREGEPNNGGASGIAENCMILEGDNNLAGEGATWDDRPCANPYPYMCERSP